MLGAYSLECYNTRPDPLISEPARRGPVRRRGRAVIRIATSVAPCVTPHRAPTSAFMLGGRGTIIMLGYRGLFALGFLASRLTDMLRSGPPNVCTAKNTQSTSLIHLRYALI